MYKPKQTKYRKQHKGRKFNKIQKAKTIHVFCKGVYRLRSLGHSRITEKQIITMKDTAAKKLKRKGRFGISLFADTPVSKKPLEIRMGKGKGAVDYWVSKLSPGSTLFELSGISDRKSVKIFKEIKKKLPIKTSIDFYKN